MQISSGHGIGGVRVRLSDLRGEATYRRSTLRLLRFLVLDSFIYAQDQARGLRSSLDSVYLNRRGLPDESFQVVRDPLVDDVNTRPSITLRVSHAQLVEHIRSVETRVIAKLPRDDLKGLCERGDDELLLTRNGARVLAEVFRDFHFKSATPCDDIVVFGSFLDDHNGVVEGALNFSDKLFSASAKDEGTGLCCGAALEKVEALATDLTFFESLAST
jgi:hypothetical protein